MTVTADVSEFERMMARIQELATDLAKAALGGYRRRWVLGMPSAARRHAFAPDFDLRCTVRPCGLGPEEHQ